MVNSLCLKKVNEGLSNLKEIKVDKLKNVVKKLNNSTFRMSTNKIPEEGGVYVFWWTGDKSYFFDNINREHQFAGSGKRKISMTITDDWINSFGGAICLYVGKNHCNIKSRIGKHLRLKTERNYCASPDIFVNGKSSTTGQLKRGMEKLFLTELNVRNLILENVGISFFPLSGDDNSINRFYLEDKAIGEFYPLINIDIER